MVKIIALWSIFIFSISSFLWVLSLNKNIPTWFLIESWIPTVSAYDNDDDRNEKDLDSDDNIPLIVRSNNETKKQVYATQSKSEKHTAPNGKVYDIKTIWSDFSFMRSNGSVSTITFKKKSDLIDYIDSNNQLSLNNHTAPNGKVYSIVLDANTWLTTFKRSDGTISSKTFSSSSDAIYFIDVNNRKEEKKVAQNPIPVVPVKKTVLKPITTTSTPIIVKPPVITKPVVLPTPPVVVQPTVVINPKPVVSTPTPATTPVYTAPKVDTTTRAS